jgi:hypothetical protein
MRRVRNSVPARVVRLDDSQQQAPAEGVELSSTQEGSLAVVTLVGRVDRPDGLVLASRLAELVAGGSERVVVDVEKAHPASRVIEALSVASPVLERHGAQLALVPPKGEMLSTSIQLTANGLGGWVGVYDSVTEASKAIGPTHARP